LKGYEMTTLKDYENHIRPSEQFILWPYVDSEGNVTVGIGHNVNAAGGGGKDDFLALPFRLLSNSGSSQPAGAKAKSDAFDALCNAPRSNAVSYQHVTNLRLSRADAQDLFAKDVERWVDVMCDIVNGVSPGLWETGLSDGARLALVDIGYNGSYKGSVRQSMVNALKIPKSDARLQALADATLGVGINANRLLRNQMQLGATDQEARRRVATRRHLTPDEQDTARDNTVGTIRRRVGEILAERKINTMSDADQEKYRSNPREREDLEKSLRKEQWTKLSDRQRKAILDLRMAIDPQPLSDAMLQAIADLDVNAMVKAAKATEYDTDPDWAWLAGIEAGLMNMSPPPAEALEDIANCRNLPVVAWAQSVLGVNFWAALDPGRQRAILTLIEGAKELNLTYLLRSLLSVSQEAMPGFLVANFPSFAADRGRLALFEADFFHLPLGASLEVLNSVLPMATVRGNPPNDGLVPAAAFDNVKAKVGDEVWNRLPTYEARRAIARVWQRFNGLPEPLLKAVQKGKLQGIIDAAVPAGDKASAAEWEFWAEVQADLRGIAPEEARKILRFAHPEAEFSGPAPRSLQLLDPSKVNLQDKAPWTVPKEDERHGGLAPLFDGAARVAEKYKSFFLPPAFGAEPAPSVLSGPGGAMAKTNTADGLLPGVLAAVNAGSGGGAGAAGLPGQLVGTKYAGASLPSWSAAAAMEALVEPYEPGPSSSGHGDSSSPEAQQQAAQAAQGSAASPAPLSDQHKAEFVAHIIAELNKGQFGSRLIDALFRAVVKRMDRELLQSPRSGPRIDSRLSPLHPAMPYDGR
jgi:hypothetical protein